MVLWIRPTSCHWTAAWCFGHNTTTQKYHIRVVFVWGYGNIGLDRMCPEAVHGFRLRWLEPPSHRCFWDRCVSAVFQAGRSYVAVVFPLRCRAHRVFLLWIVLVALQASLANGACGASGNIESGQSGARPGQASELGCVPSLPCSKSRLPPVHGAVSGHHADAVSACEVSVPGSAHVSVAGACNSYEAAPAVPLAQAEQSQPKVHLGA